MAGGLAATVVVVGDSATTRLCEGAGAKEFPLTSDVVDGEVGDDAGPLRSLVVGMMGERADEVATTREGCDCVAVRTAMTLKRAANIVHREPKPRPFMNPLAIGAE